MDGSNTKPSKKSKTKKTDETQVAEVGDNLTGATIHLTQTPDGFQLHYFKLFRKLPKRGKSDRHRSLYRASLHSTIDAASDKCEQLDTELAQSILGSNTQVAA